ncbi:MAG: TetR family transcriptional regulator C-terminal domain-containing protein [Rhodospirillaceae bacterium]|nr:TetR family transcriptional regulator C-terminal domain-containing protein [Rhodospirillaceae bacterium]
MPVEPDHGGGIRQRSRASIERRILDAAESVFAEAGFNGATTAEIARRAGIPKANLHYYFKTKDDLYQQVLTGIVNTWLHTADEITAEADPAHALAHYITAKIELAREQPIPSRVFANEVIHGAPHLGTYLGSELRSWVEAKAKVIRGWITAGKMREVDPRHLLFMIWASTQTYADFAAQISAVLGRDQLSQQEYKAVARQVTEIILRGCGLTPPNPS